MKTFRRWNHKVVEDNGYYMTKEAKSFVTAFRNMLRRELEKDGINVIRVTANHYDLAGFLEKNGKFIYIAYSIPRYGSPIDFGAGGPSEGVLFRSALNDKDYRGGINNFCSILELPERIRAFYKSEANIEVIAA